MERLLGDGVASVEGSRLSLPEHATPANALLPLLCHGAMESPAPPDFPNALQARLHGAFATPTVKRFVRDARAVSGNPALRVRAGEVLLRTDNPLTARFRPPRASDVHESLANALLAIEQALLEHRREPWTVAVTALVGSQILLTIHPFADGNGRTARFYYAAQLSRFGALDAVAILAMMLMYRGGANAYHQASWQFRAGDASPMVELFLRSAGVAMALLPASAAAAEMSERDFMLHCWEQLRASRSV